MHIHTQGKDLREDIYTAEGGRNDEGQAEEEGGEMRCWGCQQSSATLEPLQFVAAPYICF